MYSKSLYNWVFHFNTFTHKWSAFRREDFVNYFNGNITAPFSSSDINTLIEIIGKTDGDISKLKTENKK